MYQKEVQFLKTIFGDEIIRFEHFGSTSVYGLKAKPVIDMMCIVKDIDKIDSYNIEMASLGYDVAGEWGITGRRLFRKGGENRTHHLHFYKYDNPQIDRHIIVRDYLRTYPEEATNYSNFKEELAKRFEETKDYSQAKNSFMKTLEGRALLWFSKGDFLIFEKESIKVRHLQEDDKQFLVKWLSNPAVLEFYEGRDNPFDMEKVNKDFYDLDPDIIRCIVEFEGLKIGYIQFYLVNDKTSKITDYHQDEIIYGMDQFIGETQYWNRGIGTLLIKTMIDYLVNRKRADRIIMDPRITNTRAIKCYEKCGFTKKRILTMHEYHEGKYEDCWLVEYNP